MLVVRFFRGSAAVLMIVLGSCTLALDGTDAPTQKCEFKGSDSPCGACILANCESALDTCCGSAACQPTMDSVDKCASGDLLACEAVDMDQTLGSCFLSWCSSACKNEGPCIGASGGCSCTNTAPTDPSKCSSLGFRACCADHGWPATGKRCDCFDQVCRGSYDDCFCRADQAGDSSECAGTHCCMTATDCHCSASACGVGTEVMNCQASELPCLGRVNVTSCSMSAP